jgi:hypothetical protein
MDPRRSVVISQPMFFPWVGMHEQVRLADVYVHYNDVQYSKGSFTNRVQVKTAGGIRWLTVPLEDLHLGQRIDEVRINQQRDWRRSHRDVLRDAYSGAPYYREMAAVVDDVYQRPWDSIADLSVASLVTTCRYFGLESGRKWIDVRELDVPGSGSQRVLDVVRAVGGTRYVTGHGAARYLDHELFEQSGVEVLYVDYGKLPYRQLHGEFTPFVSILDLIANEGRDGARFICSEAVDWRAFLRARPPLIRADG